MVTAEKTVLTLAFFFPLILFMSCLAEVKRSKVDEHRKLEIDDRVRQGKVFSLFSVVQFKNDGCQTTDTLPGGSGRRNGTCFTSSECTQKGGMPKGKCASGFGICCLFTLTSASGGSVNQNNTYLQNPGFPAAYTATTGVSYTVMKQSSDVCFLRLDFQSFTLLGTGMSIDAMTATAVAFPCLDRFVVTASSGQIIPTICGENSGQHIFVYMGDQPTDSAMLAFSFGTGTSRTWDIKTTQYFCGDINSPPEGCLQYHTGVTGRFTTFNFNGAAPATHLPNHQYSVCVRQEMGFCCVNYQVCQGVPMAFSLSNFPALAANQKALFDTWCNSAQSHDYIGIADSASTCSQAGNIGYRSKYCGAALSDLKDSVISAPICDCTPPFSILVHTDNLGDLLNEPSKGVCLEWTQVACTG